MALDYPRAWQVARAAPIEAHHPKCSYVQFSGGFLCETGCPVLADHPESQCVAMHSTDGTVVRDQPPDYGPCPGHGEG